MVWAILVVGMSHSIFVDDSWVKLSFLDNLDSQKSLKKDQVTKL